jgi:hypothetical protein
MSRALISSFALIIDLPVEQQQPPTITTTANNNNNNNLQYKTVDKESIT